MRGNAKLYKLIRFYDFSDEKIKGLFIKNKLSIDFRGDKIAITYNTLPQYYTSLTKDQLCSIIFFSTLIQKEKILLMNPKYNDRSIDNLQIAFTELEVNNKVFNEIKNKYNEFVFYFEKTLDKQKQTSKIITS